MLAHLETLATLVNKAARAAEAGVAELTAMVLIQQTQVLPAVEDSSLVLRRVVAAVLQVMQDHSVMQMRVSRVTLDLQALLATQDLLAM